MGAVSRHIPRQFSHWGGVRNPMEAALALAGSDRRNEAHSGCHRTDKRGRSGRSPGSPLGFGLGPRLLGFGFDLGFASSSIRARW